MKTRDFLNELDEAKVADAIASAEKTTSGEIRVYVSERNVKDAVAEAQKQFLRLGMSKTEQRNGVLIYIAPIAQEFAVIGDEAVNERCGRAFWQHIVDDMVPLLKQGKFTEAVVHAVAEIGVLLAKEFPGRAGDKNELPNRVERDSR